MVSSFILVSVHPEIRYFVQDQASGPEGHARKLTTGIYLIFRGLIFEHNPREIGFAFHRAGEEIGQNSNLRIDTI